MPNANRPSGLTPLEYINGAPWTGKGRMYFIPQADTNAYSIGDPVALAGSADASGVPSIVLATAGAGNKVLGSVLGAGGLTFGGMSANPNNLNTTIVPATKTTGYYVLVSDDPWIIYGVQEGGVGTALAATDVGTNINLLSGANSGFQSGWMIDNGSTGTGATLQCQILGLINTGVDNNAFGTFAKWKVRINVHQFAGGVAGI
jgi:hypothetical protein